MWFPRLGVPASWGSLVLALGFRVRIQVCPHIGVGASLGARVAVAGSWASRIWVSRSLCGPASCWSRHVGFPRPGVLSWGSRVSVFPLLGRPAPLASCVVGFPRLGVSASSFSRVLLGRFFSGGLRCGSPAQVVCEWTPDPRLRWQGLVCAWCSRGGPRADDFGRGSAALALPASILTRHFPYCV